MKLFSSVGKAADRLDPSAAGNDVDVNRIVEMVIAEIKKKKYIS